MTKAKFDNGDLLRDQVTGFEGIVMVVAYYSTGCIHYGVQQQKVKEDGSVPDWQWLDESRFRLVRAKAVSFDIPQTVRSGPMPSGPQM